MNIHDAPQSRGQLLLKRRSRDLEYPKHQTLCCWSFHGLGGAEECCFTSVTQHKTTINGWHWWKVTAISSHSTPQSPSRSSLVLTFPSLNWASIPTEWKWVSWLPFLWQPKVREIGRFRSVVSCPPSDTCRLPKKYLDLIPSPSF